MLHNVILMFFNCTFQVNNESALRFYQKFGFKETDVAKNYYKRITPNDAFILEKIVNED